MSSSNKGLLHTETGGYKKNHWSQDKVTVCHHWLPDMENVLFPATASE